MKYIKLLMLIVAVSFFASCSDDDDYNSQKVLVGFESNTIVTSEGAGLMEIPVKIDGKYRNGDIRFRIEVEEVGENPAIKDSMYYVTGYDFNVPSDSLIDHVNVEIKFINDRIPAPTRKFNLNIVALKGAEPGITTTTIILNDNDGPEYVYESLFGKYQAEVTYAGDKVNAVGHMTGTTAPTDPSYNHRLKFSMKLPTQIGSLPITLPMLYTYDAETHKGLLNVEMNKSVAVASAGGHTLNFILINNKPGEGNKNKPLDAPFTISTDTLRDAQGNPILDRDGNIILFNSPGTITFKFSNNIASLYQTEYIQEEPQLSQTSIGVVRFLKFKFDE